MPLPRFRIRTLMIAVAVVCAFAGLICGIIVLCHTIETWGAALHQRSVTRSLADWEREFAVVRDRHEADRAIDMLEYVAGYYVPGSGYRGDAITEAALKNQRQRTLNAIATGLRQYAGQDFGVDAAQWRAWATQQDHSAAEIRGASDAPKPR